MSEIADFYSCLGGTSCLDGTTCVIVETSAAMSEIADRTITLRTSLDRSVDSSTVMSKIADYLERHWPTRIEADGHLCGDEQDRRRLMRSPTTWIVIGRPGLNPIDTSAAMSKIADSLMSTLGHDLRVRLTPLWR